MIATCLHICQVAAEMGQWALMLTYARKALDTPQNEEPVTQVMHMRWRVVPVTGNETGGCS